MADGLVVTGATGIDIDNSVVGTSAYRQRVVIGADNSSAALVNPSTVWPTSATMGLPVRLIGSSGIVLGSVAPSTNWALSSGTAMIGTVVSATSGTVNLSTTSVVGLTTTAIVGLTTTSIVGLSSALSNYITNSTTVPVYLGVSSGNVVGLVGLSSAVTLSSGALTLGTLTTGTVVGLTTTSVVSLTTTSIAILSSGILTLGTLTTGTFVNLSSGTLTIGTLTTGTIVGLTTALANTVTLTTVGANLVMSPTTAGTLGSSNLFVGGGIVASTANTNATISSGNAQNFQVDRSGALTVNIEGPRQFVKSANLVTVANTCFQQLIAAPGANLVTDIISLQVYSTSTGSATQVGVITVLSSCGQQTPGQWQAPIFFWLSTADNGFPVYQQSFTIPLTQLTANNAWGVLSTGSVVTVWAQYVVGTS